MADIATAATEASPFVAELESKNLHPLWDRYQRITPIKPQPQDAPFLWRWREVEPLLQRSVGEVSINDIERRALIMAHPAFGAETTTTSTLLAAFTVLDPGERARPHRHTGAAVRFATRAEGAVTIVNGRRCEMKAGDLILTPPMVWHGHINESDHRIIWFDAANMPLIRAVDAHFFEPGDPRNNEFWQVDQGEEALWTEAGLRAEGVTAFERATERRPDRLGDLPDRVGHRREALLAEHAVGQRVVAMGVVSGGDQHELRAVLARKRDHHTVHQRAVVGVAGPGRNREVHGESLPLALAGVGG